MAGSGSYARPMTGKTPIYILGGILAVGGAMALDVYLHPATPEQQTAMQALDARDAAEAKLEQDATVAQRWHKRELGSQLGDANKYTEIAMQDADKPAPLRDDVIVVADLARMVAAGVRYKVDGIPLRVVNDDLTTVGKIPTLTQEEKAILGDAKKKVTDAQLAIK